MADLIAEIKALEANAAAAIEAAADTDALAQVTQEFTGKKGALTGIMKQLGTQAQSSADTRNLHMAMGVSAAALYFTSASFAIFAPKPDGIKDTGSTKWHRYLSYVHLPLMIAVPILGNMARSQAENGERTSGAASLHGPAASLLLGTYLISVTVLVFNF